MLICGWEIGHAAIHAEVAWLYACRISATLTRVKQDISGACTVASTCPLHVSWRVAHFLAPPTPQGHVRASHRLRCPPTTRI